MRIKQIPEDFIVDEIYDLNNFKERNEGRKYYYFKLTKKNYSQIRALQKVAKIFNTSKKLVHFAGTKDKMGITSQLISVSGIKEINFEKNLEYFNNNVKDLQLEFLGVYNGRINLGDNHGNKFKITIRDLCEQDINKLKKNINFVKEKGVLNYFDEQRFGYGNNSHIVGKYILQNKVEFAIKEILTTLPDKPSENLKEFVNFVENNWDEIKNANVDVIDEAKSLAPKFLEIEVRILGFLRKYRNDFAGAFRIIHKKQRTLYINAYQSYVFNEILNNLDKKKLEEMQTIDYICSKMNFDGEIKEIVDNILNQDKVTSNDFNLPSMPELKPEGGTRNVWIRPNKIEIDEISNDELNEGRQKSVISFELESGAYATNVVKQLFL